ncbi:GCN5 family acetyltransferase [Humibacillus sp. DSM 29435]|uniref:GNAT family N-acetyltransferase n=1 Tax=Humibacillus sp. DSM 29435 TaxID=1869167 RepID=UPI000871CADA|nr:GNAT family N-acetyltransferase [Humibacillus sp. DSM 29435]OFE16195.1 GCN5 family acetyltransferase [Humibacillus sp. DSM 29435]
MAEVTIRRAGADDAFVVAALHLQSARDLGMRAEPGFLDRFVDAWLRARPDWPTWIAQREGEHAGILETRRLRSLPWPTQPEVTSLHVENLFVAPAHRGLGVEEALAEAMIEWAHSTDITSVRATADDRTRRLYDGLGFSSPGRLMEFDLREPS